MKRKIRLVILGTIVSVIFVTSAVWCFLFNLNLLAFLCSFFGLGAASKTFQFYVDDVSLWLED